MAWWAYILVEKIAILMIIFFMSWGAYILLEKIGFLMIIFINGIGQGWRTFFGERAKISKLTFTKLTPCQDIKQPCQNDFSFTFKLKTKKSPSSLEPCPI